MQQALHAPDSFLIGFPRSGTNFLQSVVESSCNRAALSIYDEKVASLTNPVSVKSHAPDLPTLRREIAHLLGPDIAPAKIVVIFRDPRDVMISCFEFSEVALQTTLNQQEFISELFYRPFHERAREAQDEERLASLTVGEAFKLHVRNWLTFQHDTIQSLQVRYEDLTSDPGRGFREILDFLEFDGPIAEDKYEVKVSQYSETKRDRGKANGWIHCRDRYGVLIDEVEKSLGQEIAALGY